MPYKTVLSFLIAGPSLDNSVKTNKYPYEKATGRCLVLHKYLRFAVCGTKFKLTLSFPVC